MFCGELTRYVVLAGQTASAVSIAAIITKTLRR
jgi:hypothetical protein